VISLVDRTLRGKVLKCKREEGNDNERASKVERREKLKGQKNKRACLNYEKTRRTGLAAGGNKIPATPHQGKGIGVQEFAEPIGKDNCLGKESGFLRELTSGEE